MLRQYVENYKLIFNADDLIECLFVNMDLEQDLQFLENFEHSSLHQTILTLTEENKKLKRDNKRKFDIISQQADVIKRYRTALKSVHSVMQQNLGQTTSKSPASVDSDSSAVETSGNEGSDGTVDKLRLDSESTEHKYVISDSELENSEENVAPRELKQQSPFTHDKLVKYPRDGDLKSCTDIAEGQFVWNAIVHTFNTSFGGSITSDMMLKAFPGSNQLTNKPALTTNMIDKYFRTGFSIAPGERTFQVRSFVNADKRMWVIMMPKWLNEVYRKGVDSNTAV